MIIGGAGPAAAQGGGLEVRIDDERGGQEDRVSAVELAIGLEVVVEESHDGHHARAVEVHVATGARAGAVGDLVRVWDMRVDEGGEDVLDVGIGPECRERRGAATVLDKGLEAGVSHADGHDELAKGVCGEAKLGHVLDFDGVGGVRGVARGEVLDGREGGGGIREQDLSDEAVEGLIAPDVKDPVTRWQQGV